MTFGFNCRYGKKYVAVSNSPINLGSYWVSGFDEKELSDILEILGQVEVIEILLLKYSEFISTSPHKFSLNEIVHYENTVI